MAGKKKGQRVGVRKTICVCECDHEGAPVAKHECHACRCTCKPLKVDTCRCCEITD